jgi:hypothetical protein
LIHNLSFAICDRHRSNIPSDSKHHLAMEEWKTANRPRVLGGVENGGHDRPKLDPRMIQFIDNNSNNLNNPPVYIAVGDGLSYEDWPILPRAFQFKHVGETVADIMGLQVSDGDLYVAQDVS